MKRETRVRQRVWIFRILGWWLGVEIGLWHPVPGITTLYIEISGGREEVQTVRCTRSAEER